MTSGRDAESDIDRIESEIQDLKTERESLKKELFELHKQYDREINELRSEADALAIRFRDKYTSASEAFEAGNGTEAKELSNEGHALENQCRSVNSRIADMLTKFQYLKSDIIKLSNDIHAKGDKVAVLRRNSIPAQGIRTRISGFEGYSSNQLLSKLPRSVFKFTTEIKLMDLPRNLPPGLTLGYIRFDAARKTGYIEIYRQPSITEMDQEQLLSSYRGTIRHEVGHIIFDCMIDQVARFKWGMISNSNISSNHFITTYAEESFREDFGECVREYLREPMALKDFDSSRFEFIDKIFHNIDKSWGSGIMSEVSDLQSQLNSIVDELAWRETPRGVFVGAFPLELDDRALLIEARRSPDGARFLEIEEHDDKSSFITSVISTAERVSRNVIRDKTSEKERDLDESQLKELLDYIETFRSTAKKMIPSK